jgi:tetratricopeptide (TPR) repeat protein
MMHELTGPMITTQRQGTWFRPQLRPMAIAAASVFLIGGSYLAAALAPPSIPSSPQAPAPDARDVAVPVPLRAAGASSELLAAIDHEIGLWSASLELNEGNFIAAGTLGALYLQRARLTGDLADYGRALDAADRSIEADPIYWSGHALRASVLFALHDFPGALDEARATYAAAPDQLEALAVIGDASLELGDLEAADVAYQQLAEMAPSAPVWSRQAHLAFIRGDTERALDLVGIAATATDPVADPAAAAFYHFQLGDLRRASGDARGAEGAYLQALAAVPEYAPATAGIARVREAEGHRAEAMALLAAAIARVPQPELIAALGDLHALDGDAAAAERQYALVERIGEVAAATGSVYDRQRVLFAADHERDLQGGIALARAELAVRHDIYAHDALAWVLFKAGELDEAAAEAEAALAMGTQDPRLAYHAGMIAAAQGRTEEARSLLRTALEGAAYLPPLQVPLLERAIADLVELPQ